MTNNNDSESLGLEARFRGPVPLGKIYCIARFPYGTDPKVMEAFAYNLHRQVDNFGRPMFIEIEPTKFDSMEPGLIWAQQEPMVGS